MGSQRSGPWEANGVERLRLGFGVWLLCLRRGLSGDPFTSLSKCEGLPAGVRGWLVGVLDGGYPAGGDDVASACFFLRMDSPLSSTISALWTSRSRTASARVGSWYWLCQSLIGSWLVTSTLPRCWRFPRQADRVRRASAGSFFSIGSVVGDHRCLHRVLQATACQRPSLTRFGQLDVT